MFTSYQHAGGPWDLLQDNRRFLRAKPDFKTFDLKRIFCLVASINWNKLGGMWWQDIIPVYGIKAKKAQRMGKSYPFAHAKGIDVRLTPKPPRQLWEKRRPKYNPYPQNTAPFYNPRYGSNQEAWNPEVLNGEWWEEGSLLFHVCK